MTNITSPRNTRRRLARNKEVVSLEWFTQQAHFVRAMRLASCDEKESPNKRLVIVDKTSA